MTAHALAPGLARIKPTAVIRSLVLTASLVCLIALPSILSHYWITVVTNIAIAFAIAAPLNLLTGNAGQFSLGNAAFLATGAFTGALVVLKYDFQMPVALVVAAVTGGLVGLVAGLPSLRLRGAYLLMSTLAAHYLVVFAAQQFQSSQFGAAGAVFPPLQVAGLDLSSDRAMYFVIAAFAGLVALIIRNVMRSGFGRALEAVKERDHAAAASGISVVRTKLGVWVLSSALISAGGVLQAYFLGAATTEFYTLDLAISYIAIIIVGGLGSIGGSLLGAGFVTLVPVVVSRISESVDGEDGSGLLSHPLELQTIVYGAIIVIFVVLRPDGLIGLVRSGGERIRHEVKRRWR